MRKMLRRIADTVYTGRLAREVGTARTPRHLGILIDGNRRWAKSAGYSDPSDGHRVGGAKIETFLHWCDEVDIQCVTIFMLSDDNLNRPIGELEALLDIVQHTVAGLAAPGKPWELSLIGALDILPGDFLAGLKESAAATAGRTGGTKVNIAVGYGGHREISDAVCESFAEQAAEGLTLEEILEKFGPEQISRHIYTAEQPPLDLIIRTSGELRLSGFMLWQSAYAEAYFCECYWPDFRKLDFLRAMRSYARRERRFGL